MKLCTTNIKVLTLSLILIFNPGFTICQDTSRFVTGEIKVFSNKIITDRFSSPTSIQFLEKEKIDAKNGETLSEVLQLAGSVFIKSYGGNGALSTISMNGLGSEHTLILLNGFKISTSQNAQVDLATVSKDKIDRIEILNNGSSSLYGSEAMGGVINIITKNNHKENLKLNLHGELGSYGQKKFAVAFSKNWKVLISISVFLKKHPQMIIIIFFIMV